MNTNDRAIEKLLRENKTLRQNLATVTTERDQLHRQVREFRSFCDPDERVVMVTAAEMGGPR